MTSVVAEGTRTSSVGIILDAVIGRLTYDEEFAAALAKNPGDTLDLAGLHLDKESVEMFIKGEPARFDALCDRLSELVSPDTLAAMAEPTCG